MNAPAIKPWYREPWPWLLMAGPAIVIVAAIFTAYLAVSSADGVVSEDYYKKGLAVGKTIASSENARKYGLGVALRTTAEGFSLKLSAVDAGFVPPPKLVITLSHPTRAGLDQTAMFEGKGNEYAGKLRLPASGHWLVLIEDESKSWRLMGNVVLPAAGETVIGGSDATGTGK